MSGSMAELDTAQNKLECINTDDHSFKDCGGFERDSNVHPGPAAAPVWGHGAHSDASLLVPHPYQPGMVDSLTQRFHCTRQSPQCQLMYPDFLLEPQASQYQLLSGPVAPPADSSHPNSALAPWFANEPILCSMMPGDLHGPLASICVPRAWTISCFRMGRLNLHPTSHSLCELVEDSKPASPVPPDSVSHVRVQRSGNQHAATSPPAQTAGTCQSKSRKPCHCTRSQCLKLYCECFANGVMCSNCDCSNCHNNAEHKTKRHQAIKSRLGRNPDAFRSKIAAGKSGEVKGWHNKGCNCKRSGCLKNYCECYEANIMCTSSCKCVDCRNYDDGLEKGLKEKNKWPMSVITSDVVEVACSCLLAQAEEAERDADTPAQAEHMVLDEFGHCLAQIVKAMFK